MGRKRITVKQFRKMADQDVHHHWIAGIWPFDKAPCGGCLTMHRDVYKSCHPKITRAVTQLFGSTGRTNSAEELKANATQLFALRKKFDRLYRAAAPSEVKGEGKS